MQNTRKTNMYCVNNFKQNMISNVIAFKLTLYFKQIFTNTLVN